MNTPDAPHHIIVIGSSAGGWDALPMILENLPADLPASVFVVQHLSSVSMGNGFRTHLAGRSLLPCDFGVDNEPIKPGRVYLAPPDHHLLLTQDRIRITHGPRENGFRPAVDTLFRSAAAYFNANVIGIILSGMRDDGVEGLSAISRSGGVTMVQDPATAPFPDMPQAAINQIEVDYVVPVIEMGLVLSGLVSQPRQQKKEVPLDVLNEATIAERVLTSINSVERTAELTEFTCPSCGGVLWDVNHGNQVHSYRCHAGHAFSPDSLFQFKTTEIEETLWASLRLLEEQKRMLEKFSSHNSLLGREQEASLEKRLEENQRYIDRLRSLLLAGKFGNGNGTKTSPDY
ncbi:chemotaxis protein CheB [Sabulibacter ruber]|uniref:chemotaxis protein CheB n=1 Tax=Sabulibacter ruber TaxID=2811901 RepID=UPI001A966866|nr:chemotaxis protein CheB [Sabulibacter ruber]